MLFLLNSFAKINLFLSVGNKLESGYHSVSTLMAYTDICDRITVTPLSYGSGLSVQFTGKFGHKMQQKNKNNSIVNLMKVMHRKYDVPVDFDIKVEKNIPIASGLGGGSSNCGAVLNFMNYFFGLDMSFEEKTETAKILGADVPFFTQSQAAICSGIGEVVNPVCLPQWLSDAHVVLFDPAEKISTKSVYELYSKNNKSKGRDKAIISTNHKLELAISVANKLGNENVSPSLFADARNMLTESAFVAITSKQIIESVSKSINASLLLSGITGAGSAGFMIYQNKNDAFAATTIINRQFPTIRTYNTRLLSDISSAEHKMCQIGSYYHAA